MFLPSHAFITVSYIAMCISTEAMMENWSLTLMLGLCMSITHSEDTNLNARSCAVHVGPWYDLMQLQYLSTSWHLGCSNNLTGWGIYFLQNQKDLIFTRFAQLLPFNAAMAGCHVNEGQTK